MPSQISSFIAQNIFTKLGYKPNPLRGRIRWALHSRLAPPTTMISPPASGPLDAPNQAAQSGAYTRLPPEGLHGLGLDTLSPPPAHYGFHRNPHLRTPSASRLPTSPYLPTEEKIGSAAMSRENSASSQGEVSMLSVSPSAAGSSVFQPIATAYTREGYQQRNVSPYSREGYFGHQARNSTDVFRQDRSFSTGESDFISPGYTYAPYTRQARGSDSTQDRVGSLAPLLDEAGPVGYGGRPGRVASIDEEAIELGLRPSMESVDRGRRSYESTTGTGAYQIPRRPVGSPRPSFGSPELRWGGHSQNGSRSRSRGRPVQEREDV
jgi:hypothetical protein